MTGDIRSLARLATLIENRSPSASGVLRDLFPKTGHALVIGVTGPPGAGKSTLVDLMVAELRGEGRRVGVIAVDPTSPYSGGAILGDRIRMQRHHGDPGVFIRSMATRGRLGGLAPATADLTLLLDAAGYDAVILETVGVGQDEVEVAKLADVTVVLLVPGLGDDVQALKAGIMEIADVFVINKSDLPGADRVEREVRAVLGLAGRPDGWVPAVVKVVASEGRGAAETLSAIREYAARGGRQNRAVANWTALLREMLREKLLDRFEGTDFQAAGEEVASRRRDPYSLIDEWLQAIRAPEK